MRDDGYIWGRQQFAKANNWRFRDRMFSLPMLALQIRNRTTYDFVQGNPVDHCEYYNKDGRPVAIVGHNYDGTGTRYGSDDIVLLAGKHGLVVHIAPEPKAMSYYYPGATTLLVITRPGTNIIWPTAKTMEKCAAMHKTYWDARRELEKTKQKIRQNFWSKQ